MTIGSVTAVAILLREHGPGATLVWLLMLTTGSFTAVGAWLAATMTWCSHEFLRAGAWLAQFSVLTTLIGTWEDLYFRMLAVLAALFIVSLRLQEAAAEHGSNSAG